MHARIDRQKCAIPKKYDNRYPLENLTGRTHRQNVLEIAPMDAPWSLYWNGCLSELGSDLYDTGSGPLGVCAPPRTLNAPQKIPPSESAAIWLETIVSSNDEMGRKGLSGSALEHLHATPNVCPE
jgi:hypothetical protein